MHAAYDFRSLATKSDVLVENFVPGKLDELGLGYADLKEAAPGLIYCSVTGFGSDGPYRESVGSIILSHKAEVNRLLESQLRNV